MLPAYPASLLIYLAGVVRVFVFFTAVQPIATQIPVAGRIVLSFVCAVLASPLSDFLALSQEDLIGLAAALYLLAEIGLGFALSVPFTLVLQGFTFAGRNVDVLRGAQQGEQLYPGFGPNLSSLELAASLAAVALLFLGFGERLMRLILHPPLLQTGGMFQLSAESLLELGGVMFADVLVAFVLLTAPVYVVTISLDLVLVFLSRQLGKLNLYGEIFPLKLLLVPLSLVVLGGSFSERATELIEQTLNTAFGAN